MAFASVVIPAHDEGSVIERCLHALGATPDAPLEIVVACNGCRDDTAARARRAVPDATVIELEQASKVLALNAGDRRATGFPRFYVDADIELPASSLARVAAVLERGGVLCAAPRAQYDVTGRPWPVRAFFDVWTRLPYWRRSPLASGVYALSEAGRARFAEFPDVVADDLWVQSLFSEDERVVVEDATVTIPAPRTLRDLYRVRVRHHGGTLELARVSGRRATGAESTRAAVGLCRRPAMLPAVATYLALNLLARATAARRIRAGTVTWERDETGRAPIETPSERRSMADAPPDEPETPPEAEPNVSYEAHEEVVWPPAGPRRSIAPLEPAERLHQVGPLTAALRRPLLLVLPIILIMLPSVALAMTRTPEWTAEARLLVGRLDVESNALPGFVEAAKNLAATYSRLTSANGVVDRIATNVGRSPSYVRGHIAASPIPESPIIRVETRAGSSRDAVALATATSTALSEYARDVAAGSSRSQGLLADFQRATADLADATAAAEAQQREFAATRSPAAERELTLRQARVEATRLAVDNYRQLYQSSQRGLADSNVTVVQAPHSLGSDRRSTVMLAGATGALGGFVVGLAFVTLLENRHAIAALRRRGRPTPAE